MKLQEAYQALIGNANKVEFHYRILHELAAQCEHVTEFGRRECKSAIAMLAADVKTLVSYDWEPWNFPDPIEDISAKVDLVVADCREVVIEPTDLLFIDDTHTYEQVDREIRANAHLVRKFLVFHDTTVHCERGDDFNAPGLTTAIYEFLARNAKDWMIERIVYDWPGLMVLRRVTDPDFWTSRPSD